MPSSPLSSYYHTYTHTHPPSTLAAHLRKDHTLAAANQPPSPLALHIPPHLADAVATALWDGPPPPIGLCRLRYQGVVDTIRAYLAAPPPPQPAMHAIVPPDDDFAAATRVLEYLVRVPETLVTLDTPLRDVLVAVRSQGAVGRDGRAAYAAGGGGGGGARGGARKVQVQRCYMCRYANTAPHPLYRSLCSSCGAFNTAQSGISAPGVLRLAGRTALVTGGRVGLGFEVAVRLLRCGAAVVVSSRYPRDAERRLRALADFDDWRDRVCVLGADFRRMRDAAALVGEVKRVLAEWGGASGRGPVLDILVNNAAQTLTDSARKEAAAVDAERALQGVEGLGGLMRGGYEPTIRGGERENRILPAAPGEGGGDDGSYHDEGGAPSQVQAAPETAVLQKQPQSSWTQRIADIPYQDIGDVLAINSFVPLLLIRELMPLMGCPPQTKGPKEKGEKRTVPAAYIINVSSREGLSEASPDASIKGGYHVHTNMSKAALNMITETEAHTAWAGRRVAMNSVDPGFMSADGGWECPIGWADGAARVLWCVAKGEVEGEAVWGRFLKHFGAAEAVVRGV